MSRTIWLFVFVTVIAISVVVYSIYYSYWLNPMGFLDSQRAFIQPKDFVQAESNIRTSFAQALTAVIQAVGGAVLITGIYFTMRNIKATEQNIAIAQDNLKITQQTAEINLRIAQDTLRISLEAQINERFTKAIEQLGNNSSLAIRLGGIYALERIAKDSDKDHWAIMEVLTAYIREKSSWLPPTSQPSEESHKPSTDIQAILNALTRRTRIYGKGEDQVLDLIGTDLRGASLIDTHFEAAKLRGSHLEGAYLRRANLKGAFLYEAHLEGAKLIEADLTDAKLSGANLTDADLSRTNLKGANLRKAVVMDIIFPDAIGLTKKQIESAITDENTQLPDYLNLPTQANQEDKSDMDVK